MSYTEGLIDAIRQELGELYAELAQHLEAAAEVREQIAEKLGELDYVETADDDADDYDFSGVAEEMDAW